MYNRYISYMYCYNNGMKNKNVGFAKTERKNGLIRLWINLKGAFFDEEILGVYFFLRKGGAVLGTKIGELSLHGGSAECRFSLNEASLPVAFEKICGIYIMGENINRLIASQWDDLGIDTSQISEWSGEKSSEKTTQMNEAAVSKPQEEPPEIPIWERPIKEAVYIRPDDNSTGGVSENVIGRISEDMELKIEEEEAAKKEEELNTTNTEAGVRPGAEELISLRMNDEIIYFCDDEIYDCVDICLDDLAGLPEKIQELRNNSFVSHGFFYYHHLMLGKKDDNMLVVGVPGIYNRREKMTASMFGFNRFKFSMRGDVHLGHFGYWYREFDY